VYLQGSETDYWAETSKNPKIRPRETPLLHRKYFTIFRDVSIEKIHETRNFWGIRQGVVGKSPKKGFFPGNTQKIPPQSDLLEV
jgi:hypothetical protein